MDVLALVASEACSGLSDCSDTNCHTGGLHCVDSQCTCVTDVG